MEEEEGETFCCIATDRVSMWKKNLSKNLFFFALANIKWDICMVLGFLIIQAYQ